MGCQQLRPRDSLPSGLPQWRGACSAGDSRDAGSILGLGRSFRVGKHWKKLMDWGAWQAIAYELTQELGTISTWAQSSQGGNEQPILTGMLLFCQITKGFCIYFWIFITTYILKHHQIALFIHMSIYKMELKYLIDTLLIKHISNIN